MKEVFRKINSNILHKILNKYLKINNIELKNDITNYYFINNLFLGEYSMLFSQYYDNPYNFIFYDIFSFFNDFSPKFMIFTNNFYDKWRRNFLFRNKTNIEIEYYIKKTFLKKHPKDRCNLLLALLTPGERIQCFFTCMLHYFG